MRASLLTVLLLILSSLPLLLGGCERLNPDWCTEHARCAATEYCDPETNSCRAKEAGITEDLLDSAPVDASLAE